MTKSNHKPTLAALLAVLSIALLTSCTSPPPPVETPTATPTVDALDSAWSWCVWSHPEPYEVRPTKDDGTTDTEAAPIVQTAEEGCQKWLDKVGEAGFIEQWNEEYARTTRCAFYVLNPTYGDTYADEVDRCIEEAP